MSVAKNSALWVTSSSIPNAFTPNGDNLNDVFNIVPDDCIKSVLHLQIYNRWGNLIYDKTNLSPKNKEGWDGKLDSNSVASDVCVYIMEIAFVDGTTTKISGEVILVR